MVSTTVTIISKLYNIKVKTSVTVVITQQKIAIIQVVYSCIFIVYTHYTRNMQNMQDAYLYILYILVYLLYNVYIQNYTEFCIF